MHDYWAIERCSESKRHWSKRMRQARRKKVLSEEGGRKEARGNKKKTKHLARHALQVCHTSLGTKICSQAVSLMPRPRLGRSGGDLGQHPQHGRAQRKLFLCCQEAPKKVVASRQLPKPPLQRGAGKGSEIPRKTQLRDSSYLVKSRTGFHYFVTVISETSLGTSGRGEETLLRKQSSSRGSPQPGLLTTACFVFFLCFPPQKELASHRLHALLGQEGGEHETGGCGKH